jgi:WS/DGAT/MGAT family acyltransferase
VSLPLAELKALARAHEATLNDLVLMLCSTALRRHFGRHGPLPRKSLVAAVPVSLRAKGDASADNQASMSLIALGTDIADPVKRLAHIKAATASMKETMSRLKQVLPTDFPSLGVPWLMQAVTTVYGRAKVAERIPPLANVAISNVPGPPVPLYIAGARMLANHPTSIVVHGVGLNITVQSYDRSLDFGLMACAEAMPEVRELADAILIAFDDLKTLPVPASEAASAGLIDAVSSAARSIGSRVLQAGLAQVVSNATRLTRASAPSKRRSAR